MASSLVNSDFGLQVRRFPSAGAAAAAAAPIESDGLGADLMRRECSWCKKNMGAVPCLPHQVDGVTHSVCEECRDGIAKALDFPASPVSCAVSSAPAGRNRQQFEAGGQPSPRNVAASPLVQPSPGSSALSGETGTAAHGHKPSALEHPSGSPAASFTFRTLTGDDFGRAIKWARRQANQVAVQIRALLAAKKEGQ